MAGHAATRSPRRLPAAAAGVAVIGLSLVVALTGGASGAKRKPKRPEKRPNILLVMTDDQTVESMRVMSKVRSRLAARGVTFRRSFATTPLCCPSRATLLTGQYVRHHRVRTNLPPVGGFQSLRSTNRTLPVWLRSAGYHTAHIGKYLNEYGDTEPKLVPAGWDEWYASVDPWTYQMWGYVLNENGRLVTYGEQAVENPDLYQTDLYSRKAEEFIRRRAPKRRPFFLSVAPLAPHGERFRGPGEPDPRPAPRHAGAFAGEPLPPSPSFNEADVSDKPQGIRSKPPFEGTDLTNIRVRYRSQLESLLAVDDLVANLVDALRDTGELKRTVIVFTSDNGFFHGQHRIKQGKVFVYQESSRVPLIIRGPGVPRGVIRGEPVANIDLAPTLLSYAKARANRKIDGVSLRPLISDRQLHLGRGLLIEAYNDDGSEQYSAAHSGRYVYVEHASGEQELYDLRSDPSQLRSAHADPSYAQVERDLDRLLGQLRNCAGRSCAGGPELELVLRYATRGEGSRRCASSGVRAAVKGKDRKRVARARFLAGKRRAGADGRRPFSRKIGEKLLQGGGPTPIRAIVLMRDGREATLTREVPRRC